MPVKPWEDPKPMSEAPQDRPILAWCIREEEDWDEALGDYVQRIEGDWIVITWESTTYDGSRWVSRDSCCQARVEPVCFYEMPQARS